METSIRKHAAIRLNERTNLSQQDIKRLIDSGKAYPVGMEKHKTHYVFYSIIDDYYFVIVRDEINKEIITVYPWHYQPNRCLYDINSKILSKVKELVIPKKEVEPIEVIKVQTPKIPVPKVPSKKALLALAQDQITAEKVRLRKLQKHHTLWIDTSLELGNRGQSLGNFYTNDIPNFLTSEYFLDEINPKIKRVIHERKIAVSREVFYSIGYLNSVNTVKIPFPELTKYLVETKSFYLQREYELCSSKSAGG